jgi:BirA family biotin operon repressor/biotin-[acetyl-CoA-carboxylase] ligase
MINIHQILSNPELKRIGKHIQYRQTVTSTNRVLYKMAVNALEGSGEPLPDGQVLIAEEQVAGRGRMNRVWVSPRGKGLWFSVLLYPELPVEKSFLLTFLGAVAVAEAIFHTFEIKSVIKWPNDVLVKGRKYCGILTETRIQEEKIQFAVVGIGLNLNQTLQEITESYGPIATSLRIILHRSIEPQQAFVAVLTEMDRYYEMLKSGQGQGIVDKWKEYAAFLGTEVTVVHEDQPYMGIAKDIDEKGGLVLQLKSGEEKTFYSGDLFL